jgi:hypothetical protein
MSKPLVIALVVFAGLSLAFLVGGIAAVRKRRLIGSGIGLLLALLMLSLAALCGTISVATQGYRALTREEVAATVRVERIAPERINAHFTFPDGREQSVNLAGDEFYVDAHILKWKPVVNMLGLHTTYELDRVAGRYSDMEAERGNIRTVFALSPQKTVNMYSLRRRFHLLSPLLDAEYGSATFVHVDKTAELEVRVSTSGLLIRPAATAR